MILDYLIIKLYILSIAVVQYKLLSCSSLYLPFIVFSILIVQSVWTPYCLSIHSFCLDLVLVPSVVSLLSCTTIVVRPIVLYRTIGLTCISSVPCTPWSTSSLLISGVPDVHTICSLLDSLTVLSHSPPLHVSIPLCCSSGHGPCALYEPMTHTLSIVVGRTHVTICHMSRQSPCGPIEG